MDVEYPAVRAVCGLMGAGDRLRAVPCDAPRHGNKASREAMYAWMAVSGLGGGARGMR